eukprot:TRINITY_DN8231_c0_g1_i12.p4 TRINITY_DN8231_c0_g1~~TRINITY_DN8231_c0_g1_i12.p4  ORF type:complete len:101 (+),score=22.88 TRINITY_DN8231_c0_g1_i12:55-357(+)
MMTVITTYCVSLDSSRSVFFFFNDTATTEIYTRSIVGSVRCVQETAQTVFHWIFFRFSFDEYFQNIVEYRLTGRGFVNEIKILIVIIDFPQEAQLPCTLR